MIIALGESLIAIGLGGSDLAVSWGLVWASLLAVVLAGALEWTYFDVVALAGERSLTQTQGKERVRLARDAYTYLHLPMIAGVILLALGLEHMPYFLAPETDAPTAPLHGEDLWTLFGGAALFLLGSVGFQLRIRRLVPTSIWSRLITALLLLVLIPVTWRLPALPTLVLVTAIIVTLALVEVRVAGDRRRRLREESRHENSTLA